MPARRSCKPVHLRTVTLPATSTLPTAAAISPAAVAAISPAALALASATLALPSTTLAAIPSRERTVAVSS